VSFGCPLTTQDTETGLLSTYLLWSTTLRFKGQVAERKPAMLTRRTGLFFGASGILALTPWAAFASSPIGRVTEGRGPAFAEAEGSARPLVPDARILLNDLVRTGSEGRVAMQLGERTRLRLGGDVRLRIDRFIADQGGTLSLGSGVVGVDTQGSLSRGLSIRSPHALIAVRGTGFVAGHEPGRGFSVLVDHGAVDVRAGGETVRLGPGEGTTILRRGAKPSSPTSWGTPRAQAFRARLR